MVKHTSLFFQKGSSMMEILVTVIILTIGLLGLAGLQVKLQASEVESYQRAQALLLLGDMTSRLTSNMRHANEYVTDTGTGVDCNEAPGTVAEQDISTWCTALKGNSEVQNAKGIGVMRGGRGCISSPAANTFLVTVAWQGIANSVAPSAGNACGIDQYNGGECTNDRCRRIVSTTIRVGNLL